MRLIKLFGDETISEAEPMSTIITARLERNSIEYCYLCGIARVEGDQVVWRTGIPNHVSSVWVCSPLCLYNCRNSALSASRVL